MLELVGRPYDENGENGFSCYSLVRYVVNTELGMSLPESPPSATAWQRYVKLHRPPLPALAVYDLLMFSEIIPGLVNHVGIMCSRSDFIHCGKAFGGVVCEPIAHCYERIVVVGRPIL